MTTSQRDRVVACLAGLCVEVRREGEWVAAVEDAELTVRGGEVLGVVGETGAGKTLSVKAMVGLLPAGARVARGSVRFGPEETAQDLRADASRRLGRDVGMVLQNPAGMFDPVVRIGAQMVEGVTTTGQLDRAAAVARSLELLRRVGFADAEQVLRLYPHQLSGGMAQRAAIALAMMPRPRVLIVDEPTAALDAKLRVEVLSLIRSSAQQEGAGVILISHDLALVSTFADTIAVLYAGRVVERGPTQAVLDAPRHPYTRLLLACSPTLESVPGAPLAVIEGTMPPPGAGLVGCRFRPRCPHAFATCEVESPPLEDVAGIDVACHLHSAQAARTEVAT
jgi:oligopeptide/dipeptide ABC transporter ATP-binding protein